MKQGLYEQVINQEILDQLNSLEQDKFIINKSDIDKEEAKAILQSDSKIDIKCLMVLQSFININIDI